MKGHNSATAPQIYYVHKDHLGSIVKLTTNTGTTVFKASYDAWGKQTVTTNLNTVMFRRGYTGHEHLPELGLINMNGRMYDPVLGRFLSPDPYVQAPDFSQNFNRYSYCLNNPLKYTDPSGEFWHIVIGAVIGGAINLAAHWDQIDNFGDGLMAFGIGAAAGGLAAATGGATLAAYGGVAAGGFIGGAVAGGMAYTTHTIVQSGGNLAAFGDPLPSPEEFGAGLGFSMATGGVINGAQAAVNGNNFWTGNTRAFGRSAFAVNNTPTVANPGKITPGPVQGISNVQGPSARLPEALQGTGASAKNIPLSAEGNYSVYQGVNATGEIKYVGITSREPAMRFAEHLRSGTERSLLQYEGIKGATGLTQTQARILEQNFINRHGLWGNGGSLLNLRNSIAPQNWERFGVTYYFNVK
jgi:RHS repeat-associated protein